MLNKDTLRVGVTGPRPENMCGVPHKFIRSYIRDFLEIYLEEFDGRVYAFSGMARGVDTIFAEQAQRMGIETYAVMPFPSFDSQWAVEDRNKLRILLNRTRGSRFVCEEGSKGAYQIRNEALVDKVDLLLAFYVPGQKGGTYNCMEYARRTRKPMIETDITSIFTGLCQKRLS